MMHTLLNIIGVCGITLIGLSLPNYLRIRSGKNIGEGTVFDTVIMSSLAFLFLGIYWVF